MGDLTAASCITASEAAARHSVRCPPAGNALVEVMELGITAESSGGNYDCDSAGALSSMSCPSRQAPGCGFGGRGLVGRLGELLRATRRFGVGAAVSRFVLGPTPTPSPAASTTSATPALDAGVDPKILADRLERRPVRRLHLLGAVGLRTLTDLMHRKHKNHKMG